MEKLDEKPLLFSNRTLILMTLPLMANLILGIIAGMVDAAMVSSAGEEAVSAISLVDSLNLVFTGLLASLGNGGSIITSQYLGAKNDVKARISAKQLLYVVVGIAIAAASVMLCFIPQILGFIYGSVEPAVFENAKIYFFWTLLGYPLFAIGNTSGVLLRSMAKNKEAVSIALGSSIINVIGNAVLIYGFDMGVAGAGISTTFSRGVWAVAGVILLLNKKYPVHFENLLNFRLDRDIMTRVLRIGSSNGVENFLFKIGRVLVSSIVSSLGTIAIAANSVTNTICNLGWELVGTIGTVLLTVVAQCVGAGALDQVRMYTKKMLRAGSLLMLIIFGAMFVLRNWLVLLFDFKQETLEICANYVAIAVAATIFSCYSFTFVPKAAFRAAGDIRYPIVMSTCSMFVFRVGLSYLFGVVLHMGLLGVWIGTWADFSFQSICNFVHLRKGTWLKKRLI